MPGNRLARAHRSRHERCRHRPSASARTRAPLPSPKTAASGWRAATTPTSGRSIPTQNRAVLNVVGPRQADRARGRRWTRDRLERPAGCERRRDRRLDRPRGERHPRSGRSAASGPPASQAGGSGLWVADGDRRIGRLDLALARLVDPTVLPPPDDERADAFFSSVAVSGDAIWVDRGRQRPSPVANRSQKRRSGRESVARLRAQGRGGWRRRCMGYEPARRHGLTDRSGHIPRDRHDRRRQGGRGNRGRSWIGMGGKRHRRDDLAHRSGYGARHRDNRDRRQPGRHCRGQGGSLGGRPRDHRCRRGKRRRHGEDWRAHGVRRYVRLSRRRVDHGG